MKLVKIDNLNDYAKSVSSFALICTDRTVLEKHKLQKQNKQILLENMELKNQINILKDEIQDIKKILNKLGN